MSHTDFLPSKYFLCLLFCSTTKFSRARPARGVPRLTEHWYLARSLNNRYLEANILLFFTLASNQGLPWGHTIGLLKLSLTKYISRFLKTHMISSYANSFSCHRITITFTVLTVVIYSLIRKLDQLSIL